MKDRLERLEREAAELRAQMGGVETAESQVPSPRDSDQQPPAPTNTPGDENPESSVLPEPQDLGLNTQDSEPDTQDPKPDTLSPDISGPNTQDPTPKASEATPEQIQRAENLIRQARLARSRGQAQQASAFLKQAEEAAPNSPIVLEFIGDDFVERKQYKNARETYDRARKLDPKNAAIETKFAKMVLQTEPIGSVEFYSEYESMANSKIAVLLSALAPGLGQIVTKEVIKGAVILGLWAAMIVWFFVIPDGVDGLMKAVGLNYHMKGNPVFHPIILVPMAIGFFIWIGAVADMNLKAKVASRRPIIRPKPPDDLPFE